MTGGTTWVTIGRSLVPGLLVAAASAFLSRRPGDAVALLPAWP